MTDDLMVSH